MVHEVHHPGEGLPADAALERPLGARGGRGPGVLLGGLRSAGAPLPLGAIRGSLGSGQRRRGRGGRPAAPAPGLARPPPGRRPQVPLAVLLQGGGAQEGLALPDVALLVLHEGRDPREALPARGAGEGLRPRGAPRQLAAPWAGARRPARGVLREGFGALEEAVGAARVPVPTPLPGTAAPSARDGGACDPVALGSRGRGPLRSPPFARKALKRRGPGGSPFCLLVLGLPGEALPIPQGRVPDPRTGRVIPDTRLQRRVARAWGGEGEGSPVKDGREATPRASPGDPLGRRLPVLRAASVLSPFPSSR